MQHPVSFAGSFSTPNPMQTRSPSGSDRVAIGVASPRVRITWTTGSGPPRLHPKLPKLLRTTNHTARQSRNQRTNHELHESHEFRPTTEGHRIRRKRALCWPRSKIKIEKSSQKHKDSQ